MLRQAQELSTGRRGIDVFSWVRSHPRAAGAVALTAAISLTGCGSSTSQASEPSPVHATVEVPHASGLEATRQNGKQEFLSDGTKVSATCVDGGPFDLQAIVESGPHTGTTVVQVPRADLSAPSVSGQDPFGALNNC